LSKKSCFVISPIGDEGSEIRLHADSVLKHIIRQGLEGLGYSVTRADKISEPGMITSQMIEHLLNDDLVVSDLSGHNPNVFYELAIRHAVRKPVVHLVRVGESIPFDLSHNRAIQFNLKDLDSVHECREELKRQVESLQKNPDRLDTPISVAVEMKSLRESVDPIAGGYAQILSALQNLNLKVDKLSGTIEPTLAQRSSLIKVSHNLEEIADKANDIDSSASDLDEDGDTQFEITQASSDIEDLVQESADILEELLHESGWRQMRLSESNQVLPSHSPSGEASRMKPKATKKTQP